jgi:hypothetical protein
MIRSILVFFLVFLTSKALAAEPKVLFEDRLDKKPGKGWTWIKQQDKSWRIQDKSLEFRVLPGQENVLARTVPNSADRPYAIEVTFTCLPQATKQYEQVGLFWYANGKQGSKFVKELIDGKHYVFPGKKEMTDTTVQLRLVVDGKKYTAQYRPGAKGEFKTASTGEVPAADKGKLQIAIACHNGPADAKHWVRIRDFRIVGLPAKN